MLTFRPMTVNQGESRLPSDEDQLGQKASHSQAVELVRCRVFGRCGCRHGARSNCKHSQASLIRTSSEITEYRKPSGMRSCAAPLSTVRTRATKIFRSKLVIGMRSRRVGEPNSLAYSRRKPLWNPTLNRPFGPGRPISRVNRPGYPGELLV